MDDEVRTRPSRQAGLPIRSIRVEVVRGADRGQTVQSSSDRVTVGTATGNDLVLTDPTVSRFHLELERAADRIVLRDHRSTNGTVVGPVRLEGQAASIPAGTTVELGQSAIRVDDGSVVLLELGGEELGLRGSTVAMKRIVATTARLSRSQVPVLLLGESGTGKELVARAIHEGGPRRGGPFVTVDCGAIPAGVFTSELFGHERGAFTGADRRFVGAFERASGGTLFLDEIGELPATLQPALLGALERRRVRRVGASEEIDVDVRVVSATNRDLRAAVNAGTFRLDLYYRLAAVFLTLPPLRERTADIPILVEHFLRELGYDGSVETIFPPERMAELTAHDWPGNVRELRNLVEVSLAVDPPPLEPAQQPTATGDDPIAAVLELGYREARGAVLHKFETRYLERLLARSGGSVRKAARLAGMDRTYLGELLKRHGLG